MVHTMATFNFIEKPHKTFFYQRKDGSIFACSEKEASQMDKFYEQVGVSDGVAYVEVLASAGFTKGQEVSDEVIKDILQRAFDAELASARGNKEKPKSFQKEWV